MKLRFLTDENIASSVVRVLRENGYDIKDIKEEGLFGINDETVQEIANKENRVVITHDKDFLNMLNNPSQKHSGVLLLRFSNQSPEHVIKKLMPMIKKFKKRIRNSFFLITDDFVRII